MNAVIDIDTLAAAVASRMSRQVPIEVALWDYADIAAYLRRSDHTVKNRYAVMPDFPKAIRLEGKGHPLYEAMEVVAWARKHKSTLGV